MRPLLASGAAQVPADIVPAFDLSGFAPSRWVSHDEFLALRSHPALPGAVAEFAGWLVKTYTKSAVLNLLLSNRGRMLLGFYVLYLDVLPLADGQECGATLGGVQTLCRTTGICSPGRAASMVAVMRFSGYVTQALDPDDNRRRILVPTPWLVDSYHRNWVRQFEAMAPLFPAAGSIPGWLKRPAFRTGFLRALGASFRDGFRVLDHVPALQPVGESNAAIIMLTEFAVHQLAGGQDEAVPFSISAIARRFGVSRAHVRNVLQATEAATLIAYRPETDGIVVLPALLEALMQLYGVLFILFHRSAMTTLADEQFTQ